MRVELCVGGMAINKGFREITTKAKAIVLANNSCERGCHVACFTAKSCRVWNPLQAEFRVKLAGTQTAAKLGKEQLSLFGQASQEAEDAAEELLKGKSAGKKRAAEGLPAGSSQGSKTTKLGNLLGHMDRVLTQAEINEVDEGLARSCYANGIPFKYIACKHFRKALGKLNQSWLRGTRLSDWTLRHNFLENENERITERVCEALTKNGRRGFVANAPTERANLCWKRASAAQMDLFSGVAREPAEPEPPAKRLGVRNTRVDHLDAALPAAPRDAPVSGKVTSSIQVAIGSSTADGMRAAAWDKASGEWKARAKGGRRTDFKTAGLNPSVTALNVCFGKQIFDTLSFGPAHPDVYASDALHPNEFVQQVDVKAGVERRPMTGALHAHIYLTISHYSQLRVNKLALQALFKQAYNKAASNGSGQFPMRAQKQSWRKLADEHLADFKVQADADMYEGFGAFLTGELKPSTTDRFVDVPFVGDRGMLKHMKKNQADVQVLDNVQAVCVPWKKHHLLHIPGAHEFLSGEYRKRKEFDIYIGTLYAMGPQSMDQAWHYYKYIVKQQRPTDREMESSAMAAS
ncbi:hypothetical protein T492DRAFT_877881 [Pavlovales sp. CCMP2436]|nr:hypothetical protein T492DRAFT_877881 [Pavlovales sp. CCMP2436]